jgi:adenylate kinase
MVKYALTGTPGTGKTSVSKLLNEKITSLSDYYEEASEGKTKDGEWLVDIGKLNIILKTSDSRIYEGNFAHKLNDIDRIIVLRCDPTILKIRLEERGYKKEKVMENLEAEAIGLIFSESIDYVGENNVVQIDTSKTDVASISKIIEKYVDGKIKVEEEIDYSERILDWY